MPQAKRGKIWSWLIKHHKLKNNELNQKFLKKTTLKNLNCSYDELLKQNTVHQHAILLDLGRTMPKHPNFSKKLGTGQLALFNVLKAYSILDPDVGYCQGKLKI